MRASAEYNRDPDVMRYREEMARRAHRPKAVKTSTAKPVVKAFGSFKVGKARTPLQVSPRVKATERQRVLDGIEMEDLRRMERGRHVGF